MGKGIERRRSGVARSPRGGVQRVPREVQADIDAVYHRGLLHSAEVQAAGFVTHSAMTQVALLSTLEHHIVQYVPTNDVAQMERVATRVRALVDNYTAIAADAIARIEY